MYSLIIRTEEERKKFLKAVKMEMIAQNMNRQELAEKTGYTVGNINNLFSDYYAHRNKNTKVNRFMAAAICRALNIEWEDEGEKDD